MGGWMNCCKEHLEWLKKDIEKHGKHWWGYVDGADRRCRCDVKGCKNKAFYEVFWDEKSLKEASLEKCVPLEDLK